jgi:hypothetical protein
MLLQVDTGFWNIEKFAMAFFGAVAAILLRYIYELYIDWKKNQTIKSLIKTDLNRQMKVLQILDKDLDMAMEHIKSGKMEPYIAPNYYYLSTAVYHSNSFIDYHKAFSNNEFNLLVSIYSSLEMFYKKPNQALIEYMVEIKEIFESGSASQDGIISLYADTTNAILTQKGVIKKLKNYINKFLMKTYSSENDIY